MTTKQRLARLREMRDSSGEALFERLGLAVQLMGDAEWVAEYGDDFGALEFLETEYFGDLCGAIHMVDLIKLRQRFIEFAAWRRNKWNVRAMLAELRTEQAKTDAGDAEKRHHWSVRKSEFDEVVQERDHAEAALKHELENLKHRDEELSELRNRVKELERENATLLGRISELERALAGRLSAAA